MKRFHLVLGIVLVIVFLLTGQYMETFITVRRLTPLVVWPTLQLESLPHKQEVVTVWGVNVFLGVTQEGADFVHFVLR
jgi:hypothetical protein